METSLSREMVEAAVSQLPPILKPKDVLMPLFVVRLKTGEVRRMSMPPDAPHSIHTVARMALLFHHWGVVRYSVSVEADIDVGAGPRPVVLVMGLAPDEETAAIVRLTKTDDMARIDMVDYRDDMEFGFMGLEMLLPQETEAELPPLPADLAHAKEGTDYVQLSPPITLN